jgi:hypothetical protein
MMSYEGRNILTKKAEKLAAEKRKAEAQAFLETQFPDEFLVVPKGFLKSSTKLLKGKYTSAYRNYGKEGQTHFSEVGIARRFLIDSGLRTEGEIDAIAQKVRDEVGVKL